MLIWHCWSWKVNEGWYLMVSMDTQIQKFKLKDRHFVGQNNRGNIDVLNITQPRIIERIHLSYLEVGTDINQDEYPQFKSNLSTWLQ